MKHIKQIIIIVLYFTFVFVTSGLSTDYYAVCNMDNCQLQEYGVGCKLVTNAVLQCYNAPPGVDCTRQWFWSIAECSLETAYDMIRNLNRQRLYLDTTRGYIGNDGKHAFYKGNSAGQNCWIEILIGINNPTPSYVMVDSDQCGRHTSLVGDSNNDGVVSVDEVTLLINGWKANTVPLATVVEAINNWEKTGRVGGNSVPFP
jgi:hypothetical protein